MIDKKSNGFELGKPAYLRMSEDLSMILEVSETPFPVDEKDRINPVEYIVTSVDDSSFELTAKYNDSNYHSRNGEIIDNVYKNCKRVELK